MATIKIKLLKSDLENVDGIGLPKTVFLDASEPCVIYYTTDGSIPTASSTVYINGIQIPPDSINFRIRAFATNGIDTSMITEFCLSSTAPMDFFGDGGTSQKCNITDLDFYPFGSQNNSPNVKWFNEHKEPLYDETNSNAFYNGYDENGDPNNFSNKLYTESNYQIEYNLLDSTQMFYEQDLSNRPDLLDFSNQNIVFQISQTPSTDQEQSNDFVPGYDPNAHVTFQDCSLLNDTTAVSYNSESFTYADVYKERIFSKIYGQGGWENQLPTMNFINSYYNELTNVMTFVYCDTLNQKYIFSSVPVTPDISSPPELANLGPTYTPRYSNKITPGYPIVNPYTIRRKIG